jgi:hypothetical protein
MLRTWLCGVAFALFCLSAQGTWKPEYAQLPPDVRDWYSAAELTAPAQRRFPYKKCCDHADVFKTQFRVNTASGEDEWYYLIERQWKRIPSDIIHWGEHAPDGQPTLFLYGGKETCFYPGDGGI